MKAFTTWFKNSFVAFLNGLQTIGEKSPSPLCENCLPATLEKSLLPRLTGSKKKQASAKKFSGAKADFQRLLDEAGVRYFTADEVFFRGARDAKLQLNTDPPRSLWPSLLAVTKVADEARHRLGKAVKINSAYRNAAYNRAIGGASASIHMRGGALDLSGSPVTLRRILREMRDEGLFRGGIGRYPTFTHVDVRGKNADW
jgi:type II secretory pathway pseudopilin PulG